MKRCIALTLSTLQLIILGACGYQPEFPSATGTLTVMETPSTVAQTESSQQQDAGKSPSESEPSEVESAMTTISVTVGDSAFTATLYDNDAVRALLDQFPMTLNMSELNGNEKYCYLPDKLPTDSWQVENINVGDLMLYGSDCLVLFYESFSTSYSYTRLGYIEDTSGLSATLGSGSAEVTFAVGD